MVTVLAAFGWGSPRVPAHVATDEASILANAERLRAALVSAATDALRDALRRTLGTVRCRPTVEGESRYLLATLEGGDYPLLEWLYLGDAASQPGLSALVAGARFRTRLHPSDFLSLLEYQGHIESHCLFSRYPLEAKVASSRGFTVEAQTQYAVHWACDAARAQRRYQDRA